MISTKKFVRKPLYVDAVRVNLANFDEIAAWCQGEILQDDTARGHSAKKYIKVRVHNPKNPRQTKAFVGDWLLYTERGYKVYTNKAFHASFDMAEPLDKMIEEAREQEESVVTPPTPITWTGDEAGPILEDQQTKAYGSGSAMEQAVSTIEAEGGTVEEATPQAIADVVAHNEAEAARENEQDAPTFHENKQVLSLEDQAKMDQEEIRELLKSGEWILAQDLAA